MPDVWLKMIYDREQGCYRPDLPQTEYDEDGNVVQEGVPFSIHLGADWQEDGSPGEHALVRVAEGDAHVADPIPEDKVPQKARDRIRQKRKKHGRGYGPKPEDRPVDVPPRGGS